MVIGKDKTEEQLKKAREAMYRIKSHFEIKFGHWVSDYDGLIYKVKFDDHTSNFIFRNIPRKYIEDKDSWKAHADYWKGLFKEVEEELNQRKGMTK